MTKLSASPCGDGQSKSDIMRNCFKAIHPSVDICGDEFKRDAKAAFFAKATEIDDGNFETVLGLCRDYIALTGHEPCGDGNVFACMHVTLFNVLGYGARYLSDKFERAFELIQKDIPQAEKLFIAIVEIADGLTEISDRIVERYVERGENDELFMCAAVILNVAYKSAHNLYVAAYEKRRAAAERWLQKRDAYNADVLFYRSLAFVMSACDKAKEILSGVAKELCVADRAAIALADLRLFALCVTKGGDVLARYLKHVDGNEKKHWYNLYKERVDLNDDGFVLQTDIVGRYLCETVDELATKRILYHSIFFESIALETAYKHGARGTAHKIVANGYDRYLELDTLYILRKYDREKYRDVIKELKVVCMYRQIAQIKPDYYTDHRHIRKLYGDEFCDETTELMKAALDGIDQADAGDPRNRSNRNTPKWAK